MNPNLIKLLGLLAASGMAAAPLAMMADKKSETDQIPGDSEEAKIMQAERQAMRNYEASPARADRMGMMTDEEELDQLRKDRQYKLDALKKLKNGF